MIIRPPNSISTRRIDKKTIYLAGSIEGDNWQKYLDEPLENLGYTIFNPRREDWEGVKEEFQNPEFFQQTMWELMALEKSNYIVMYLNPKTQSPVSLLELGLWAGSDKLVVCCPEGFWKKGYVDVVCQKYDVPQVNDLNKVLEYFKILQ